MLSLHTYIQLATYIFQYKIKSGRWSQILSTGHNFAIIIPCVIDGRLKSMFGDTMLLISLCQTKSQHLSQTKNCGSGPILLHNGLLPLQCFSNISTCIPLQLYGKIMLAR